MTPANGKPVKAKHIKRSFAVLTVLFCLTLAGFAWLLVDVQNLSQKTASLSKSTAHLSVENSKRIDEIQNSRISSCKKTYRGVRDVFRPFFPKKPRTVSQKKLVTKFDGVVKRLVRGCEKQTRPIG